MCGIYCIVSKHCHPPLGNVITQYLEQRGPDSIRRHDLKIGDIYISFVSSVLSLRGSDLVRQPLIQNEQGTILCWNGEAWTIADQPVDGNDAEAVFSLLNSALSSRAARSAQIVQCFNQIRGPFACVFFDVKEKLLYFGRDTLGRRSLLTTILENGDVVISSVCDPEVSSKWSEVEADGLYTLSVEDLVIGHIPQIPAENDTKRQCLVG
jgi:asparagine synthetase B (glutamine-hydrolysing)